MPCRTEKQVFLSFLGVIRWGGPFEKWHIDNTWELNKINAQQYFQRLEGKDRNYFILKKWIVRAVSTQNTNCAFLSFCWILHISFNNIQCTICRYQNKHHTCLSHSRHPYFPSLTNRLAHGRILRNPGHRQCLSPTDFFYYYGVP